MAGKRVSDHYIAQSGQKLSAIDLGAFSVANKSVYSRQLHALQLQMLHIQQAYYHQQRKAVIIFEGWDAAGKGGAIRRVTEKLDPRGVSVVNVSAPTPLERSENYLKRFFKHLPSEGHTTVFDRSWYGRVLIERVDGLIPQQDWMRAYGEIKALETMLLDDGVRLVKIFLHISPKEQLRRFEQRLDDPAKQWKLTDEDIRNHQQIPAYTQAIEDMFDHTSTVRAPWYVIPAERKWYARIAVLRCITDALAHDVDITPPHVDQDFINRAKQKLGLI
ncbi:hypothetical protein GCM10017044_00350 [Kordiimonas sediminis]|uniref:Polyphosphate kinase-2-related domain-containing protein n=1 Tax=Kordiimonas sediminis TaxID=1735581 RepID=A0A919AKP2_9PROT|nr:polyphosphate kinase [Kordiimonas sediminis]GHF10596.1 hypothetical protein GCM10017044_00350 [Kordiimonas sediminis]